MKKCIESRATCKMLRRDDISSIISTISELGKKSDLTNFYSALWSTILEINKDSGQFNSHCCRRREMYK